MAPKLKQLQVAFSIFDRDGSGLVRVPHLTAYSRVLSGKKDETPYGIGPLDALEPFHSRSGGSSPTVRRLPADSVARFKPRTSPTRHVALPPHGASRTLVAVGLLPPDPHHVVGSLDKQGVGGIDFNGFRASERPGTVDTAAAAAAAPL